MADSALEAIEAAVVAELQLVPGMAANGVRAVPLSLAFKFRYDEDGSVHISHHELPYEYPGAIVCVNDEAVKSEVLQQANNSALLLYGAPVVVAFYATSDGSVAGAAHRAAWKIHDAAVRRLSVFTPGGMPAGVQMLGPLRPGSFEAIPVDASTHGIASKFDAQYQIEVIG